MIVLTRGLVLLLAFAGTPEFRVEPAARFEPVRYDSEDTAIWRDAKHPEQSLILATDKQEGDGAIVVYGLDGKIRQRIGLLNRPNNIDVWRDWAVATERNASQLRVYRINRRTRQWEEQGRIPVFAGEAGRRAYPMGIGLYERRRDRAVFAIVSRSQGVSGSYVWQYRLTLRPGKVAGEVVRKFGTFSENEGLIEAIAVDPESERVYLADEDCCLREYHADPDKGPAEVGTFGKSGYLGDREGIAFWGDWLISTDQIPGNSRYLAYSRTPDHALQAVFTMGADSTDGIESSPLSFGPRYPRGFLVAMNSKDHDYWLVDGRSLIQRK